MGREFELNEQNVAWRTLFVCVDCGTIASTNSAKRYARGAYGVTDAQPTREELENLDQEDGRAVDHERCVRMEPPCPCGCDLFNTIDLLMLDYDDAQTPFVRQQ